MTPDDGRVATLADGRRIHIWGPHGRYEPRHLSDLFMVTLDRMAPSWFRRDEKGKVQRLREGKPVAVVDISGEFERHACALFRTPGGWMVETVDCFPRFTRQAETAAQAIWKAERDIDALGAVGDPLLLPMMLQETVCDEVLYGDPVECFAASRMVVQKVREKRRQAVNAANRVAASPAADIKAEARQEALDLANTPYDSTGTYADNPKKLVTRLAGKYGWKESTTRKYLAENPSVFKALKAMQR